MSSTSITVIVSIMGIDAAGAADYEDHTLEAEPETPLVALIDMVETNLTHMKVLSIMPVH